METDAPYQINEALVEGNLSQFKTPQILINSHTNAEKYDYTKINEPRFLLLGLKKISQLKNMSLLETADHIYKNTCAAFGLAI